MMIYGSLYIQGFTVYGIYYIQICFKKIIKRKTQKKQEEVLNGMASVKRL